MLRAPESNTPFWRSSWCGGLGCWWRSSRVRFMGTSLHFGGEGASLLTALLQRGQEPSGHALAAASPLLEERKAGSIARSGAHRGTCAHCIKRRRPRNGSALYSPECVEGAFCELRAKGSCIQAPAQDAPGSVPDYD